MQQTDNTELVERLCRAIAKERGVDPDEQIDVFGNKAWSWYVEDGNAIIPIIAEREAAARAAWAGTVEATQVDREAAAQDDLGVQGLLRDPSPVECLLADAEKFVRNGDHRMAYFKMCEAVGKLRSAEARAREEGAKAMQWQDIATAPKDGTRILLARYGWTVSMDGVEQGSAEWRARLFDDMAPREHRLFWTTSGHWSAEWENWNDGCEPCGLASPTHWMPVPANPPVCTVPPAGWACTRAPGHDGPCAAIAAIDPAQIAGDKS